MKHLLMGILLSIFGVIAIYSWTTAVAIAFWYYVIRRVLSRSSLRRADLDWDPPDVPVAPSRVDTTEICDRHTGNCSDQS